MNIKEILKDYFKARRIIRNPFIVSGVHYLHHLIPNRGILPKILDRRVFTLKFRDGYVLKLTSKTGHLSDVFLNEVYNSINVANETIIDVGANIGDSALYFIQNCAKKVIAIEPYQPFYNLLLENVKINNLESKIIPLNVGISNTEGTVEYVETDDADIGYSLPLEAVGIDSKCSTTMHVSVITLEDILKEFDLSNCLLKMDCEGCEYSSILNCNTETLRKFKRIIMEFHQGSKEIETKLQNAGFNTCILANGLLYAERL